MLLATTTVEDFDRFTSVFSTTMVRRAALALDLGRVAVSNAIWEKPGRFGLGSDWERVQLHPYVTERSFAHAPALAPIGELAGAHHERLNGAGYHRKTRARGLGRSARILAAADCQRCAGCGLLPDAHTGRSGRLAGSPQRSGLSNATS